MQIVIDITRSSDGRLAGTARPAGSPGEGRRFVGVRELVACLEQLCATTPHQSMPAGQRSFTAGFERPDRSDH